MDLYTVNDPDWDQLVKITVQRRIDVSTLVPKDRGSLNHQEKLLEELDNEIYSLFFRRRRCVRGIIETRLLPEAPKKERKSEFVRVAENRMLPTTLLNYDFIKFTKCNEERTEISPRSAARFLYENYDCFGIQKWLDLFEYFHIGDRMGVRQRFTHHVLEILDDGQDKEIAKIKLLILTYLNYDLYINGSKVGRKFKLNAVKDEADPDALLIAVVQHCFKYDFPLCPEVRMQPRVEPVQQGMDGL